MKKYILALIFCVCISGYGQQEINRYRYLILPEKFGFLKYKDQYNLNSFAKIHFEKLGFIVFYDTETLPDSLVDRNCTKLFADVESSGNFITTKLQIIVKDCKNTVVAASKLGNSKEKDYELSYKQAFRDAFTTFREMGYTYQPQEANALKSSVSASAQNNPSELLYAQAVANGYQLVDSSPKVVYTLVSTSNAACFIAFKGELQGVLIKKDEQWFFEQYAQGQLQSVLVHIKF